MKRRKIGSKQGFTIIEVVLVLAIAGLIFLMVFLALPALQRAQKDTQRRDQLSMLVTQLTQYQANNRNRLPKCEKACYVVPDSDTGKVDGNTEWDTFYKNYLLAQNDVFEDPNGNPYKLQIVTCSATGTTDCEIQRYNWGFDSVGPAGNAGDSGSGSGSGSGSSTGSLNNLLATTDKTILAAGESTTPAAGGSGGSGPTTGNQDYYILITLKSSCDGEKVVSNTGARKFSVAYRLEGGGTYCSNN